MAVSLLFRGLGCSGSVNVKEGAWGVLLSGDGIWAHLGMVLGSAKPVETDLGAWVERGGGWGRSSGSADWGHGSGVGVCFHFGRGVNGFITRGGGGVVRLRMVILFFFFLGLEIFKGEGLVAFRVRMVRLRVQDSSLSFTV